MDEIQQFEQFQFNSNPSAFLNADYKVFKDALILLIDGKNKEAEERFAILLKTSEDKKLRDNCANFLFDTYFSQGMWAELDELELLHNEAIDKNNRQIATICREFNKKHYLFNAPKVTLPLDLSSSGCPTTEVSINGSRKQFWLDTGAGMTVISSKVAVACHIQPEKAGFNIEASTNESVGANLACVDQIDLGGVTITNQPALILPVEQLTLKDPQTDQVIIIDGIIGWDILKDLTLEVNYADRQVTIMEPIRNEHSSPGNFFFSGYPIVKVESLEQTPLYFGYDTGAQYTHIGQSLLTKLPDLRAHRRTIHAGGVGGYKEIEVDVVEDLSLYLVDQLVNVKDSRMVLLEYATFFKLDGVLGSDICQNGTLVIDYPNRRLELMT